MAPTDGRSERFSDWAEDSDFHGVKRIARDRYSITRRVLWGLFFLVCLGFMTWQIVDRVIVYFDYPHITKVDVQFTHELEFPVVTICNLNKYRLSALTDEDVYQVGHLIELLDDNKKIKYPDYYPKSWADWVSGLNFNEIKTRPSLNNWDFKNFTSRAGNHVEETVVYCKWKDSECSAANFTTVLTHYGNCFQFNEHDGDMAHLSQKSGTGNGLKVFLRVDEADYLHFEGADDVGFKILVHSKHEPPFVKELGYGLQPGLHYFMELSEQRIKSLPDPWGECHDSSSRGMRWYNTYSVPACRIECETIILNDECGCVLPESPNSADDPWPVCTPTQYETCARAALEHTVADRSRCVCENPCEEHLYDHSLSAVKIRDSTYDHLLAKTGNKWTKAQLKGDMLVINIFFRELSYETIEQFEAYNWISLLSDIGGQMGLFLGASILTVIHLLEYVVQQCRQRCCCCKKEDRVEDVGRAQSHSNLNTSQQQLHGVGMYSSKTSLTSVRPPSETGRADSQLAVDEVGDNGDLYRQLYGTSPNPVSRSPAPRPSSTGTLMRDIDNSLEKPPPGHEDPSPLPYKPVYM